MLSVLEFDAPIHARCTLPTACKCRSTLLFKLVAVAAAAGRNWHMSLTAATQSTEQLPRVPNTMRGRRTEHSAISSSEIYGNHLLASGCYRLYPRGKEPRHVRAALKKGKIKTPSRGTELRALWLHRLLTSHITAVAVFDRTHFPKAAFTKQD